MIVYQEQVFFIVREFGGYSLGKADIFRKAMGKKIPGHAEGKTEFYRRHRNAKGFSTELAEQVFALIEPFAGYAFNKAHAFSYALIAYQTAYLKANYPVEYMTALLSAHAGVSHEAATKMVEGAEIVPCSLSADVFAALVERGVEAAVPIENRLAGSVLNTSTCCLLTM